MSENDAVEEIKQLAKQLQNLHERIPQRGTATNVILTLLDICRSVQNGNVGGSTQLMIKPPPPATPQQLTNEHAKSLSGNEISSTYVDKGTNTCHDDFPYQSCDVNSRLKISDKCDTSNHDKHKKTKQSKCCEANNMISCSTNSINFDNLQLQCMCSSDNNSIDDDYQIDDDNCDGCSRHNPTNDHNNRLHRIQHDETQSHSGSSFRERLLNFTGVNVGNNNKYGDAAYSNNSLRKRNSELVLGTNFESSATATTTTIASSVYKNSQSYRISKTFDSCDNIYTQKPTTSTTLSDQHRGNSRNKSNHSLSTDSDHKSIPYCYLERPTMKLSQSEDRNLKELKIALSSTLPSANSAAYNNPNANNTTMNNQIQQHIGNLKCAQLITHSQSCTSTSSMSSKNDKISLSLSTSSTSESMVRRQKQQQQHSMNNQREGHKKSIEDKPSLNDDDQQQITTQSESIDNQNDNKSEDNKGIIGTSSDNKVASSNVNNNNNSINNSNGNNGSSRRKGKGSESKLAIDLNDRSKYTEEVSV